MCRDRTFIVNETAEKMEENYKQQSLFELPKRSEVIDLLGRIRRIIFPGYFEHEDMDDVALNAVVRNTLMTVYRMLFEQICLALSFEWKGKEQAEIHAKAENDAKIFVERLPHIQNMLYKDVDAQFMGDPAARSKEEVILSYPGIYAIFVYRIAHELYVLDIPFIPRMLTEYAHEKTGIDIHPGAQIGESFFMDHGTGIVIGETTIIGNDVKIYQGVTLGALSTRKGQALAGQKRHPTIEDGVTIYANATILGGETVIGKNAVVAGSTFVVKSVPENTTVSALMPELKFKNRT